MPRDPEADQVRNVRILLEDAVTLADDIGLDFAYELRAKLLDAIEELQFLEAIARAKAAF